MKKILIVGGTGTLGRALVSALKTDNEVIVAGRKQADVQLDMTNIASIEDMFRKIGKIDALVVAAGAVHFAPLLEMDDAKYQIGLRDKLMGQINLVLLGMPYMQDEGSFTLISGILNRDPICTGTSAAMVNGALDGFVKAAAIEMPRGIRINAISPTVFTEAMDVYGDYFVGFESVPTAKVALAFQKSIFGAQTGQIYCVD